MGNFGPEGQNWLYNESIFFENPFIYFVQNLHEHRVHTPIIPGHDAAGNATERTTENASLKKTAKKN